MKKTARRPFRSELGVNPEWQPLPDVMREVAVAHPDALLRNIEVPAAGLLLPAQLLQLMSSDVEIMPGDPQIQRITAPNFRWGYDREGFVVITEGELQPMFRQRGILAGR